MTDPEHIARIDDNAQAIANLTLELATQTQRLDKEIRMLSAGQADLILKVRNIQKHFRPWPKNDDGCRSGCGC